MTDQKYALKVKKTSNKELDALQISFLHNTEKDKSKPKNTPGRTEVLFKRYISRVFHSESTFVFHLGVYFFHTEQKNN